MNTIANMSNFSQFLFIMGCGFLAVQFPFGWIPAIFSLLAVAGFSIFSVNICGGFLQHPVGWLAFTVICWILLSSFINPLRKLVDGAPIAFLVGFAILAVVAGIFSGIAVFRAMDGNSLSTGMKVFSFSLGIVLGIISTVASGFIVCFAAKYLNLILGFSCLVSLGVYLSVSSPKIGNIILGSSMGLSLLVWIGMFFLIALADWR